MEVTKLDILHQEAHTFIQPVKRINEGHHVSRFLMSRAYHDIMVFVLQLNRPMYPCVTQDSKTFKQVIQPWELSSPHISLSNTVRQLKELIGALNSIIDEVPPDPGPRRFGNVSFRKWYEVVEARLPDLLNDHLPPKVLCSGNGIEVSVSAELLSYLLGGFGSSQRLDYGTGHELSFLAFLGCVWKMGGFDSFSSGNEERGIVLGIIEPYLELVRRLIKTYTLEPAGSHGVWGLDDHAFLPYLFGSAQYGPAISENDETPIEGSLTNAPDPADVIKIATVSRERTKNMYFSAIGFIYDVKKGPFWEHSPMLYDISGVRAGWAKINKGMIKMYAAEVLSKFPVVQHFYFGSLFSWDKHPDALPQTESVHTTNQPAQAQPKASAPSGAALQQGVTKLPPVIHPMASSSSFVGTAAPWAKQSSVTSPMTAFPSQVDQRSISQTSRHPSKSNSKTAASNRTGGQVPTGMPPPSRAPWANNHGE
ncbi:MAG: hypothetical protein L6R42_003192 [Xanthoria sp. 1 TBL-2021]|nr:MAG: hypothetical protein L6R42_003192 [Xanthoria sp. 1 TBL-2021]